MVKKLCSIVLTLAVLLSAVSMLSLSVSATETDYVPQVLFAQKTNPEGDKQNIRFVAEVPQTITEAGISTLGYDVIATFEKGGDVKKISYNIEGSSVFESLTATALGGTTNVVAAKTGKYFFALTIKNVPTNYGEIFLDVKTYSKIGDVKTYSAESSQFCFDDGFRATTKLIYAEDFSGDSTAATANVVTELGWGKVPLAGNHVDVTYTEDGMAKLANKWGISSFVDKSKLDGVTKYTLEMDAKVDAPASDKNALFNIVFNQNTATAGITAQNLDCMLLGFRSCDENGQAIIGGQYLGVNLTRYYLPEAQDKTKQEPIFDKFVLIDVNFGEVFDIRLDVDTTAGTIKVYINSVLVLNYAESKFTGNKLVNVNAGTMGLWVQNTTAYVDNIKVVDAESLIYRQDFGGDSTKATASVVTELGWGKVPLAGNHVDVTYTEDGMAKLADKWGMSSFVENSTLAKSKKYVLKMDAKVDAPASDKNALFNIVFNQNTATADFTTQKLDCMLLGFRSCDANGKAITGGQYLGVNLTRYYLPEAQSKTNQELIFDKFVLIDVNFGEVFDIRLDVDTTAGTIKVYINSVLVLSYAESNFTQNKLVDVNAGTMGLWVQHTTAYVDNIRVTDLTSVASLNLN